jgi:twitching motility protein PilT
MTYFDLPPILEKMLSVAENISDLNFSVGRPRRSKSTEN